MKVDLGCGSQKNPGFIGVDRQQGPDVDLTCDIQRGIPLSDDSVDLLFAVHSLQYVDPLLNTMKEIYRICKHKAVVCIIAPYAHTYYHAVNPHYKSWFNEYSPLFFTNRLYRDSYLSEMPYTASPLPASDEASGINFQLLNMELFYLEPFRPPLYEEDEQNIVRQIQPNVVDEIMFHFLVVKEPITKEEIEDIAMRRLDEPMQITERRRKLLKSEQELETSPAMEQVQAPPEKKIPFSYKYSSAPARKTPSRKKQAIAKKGPPPPKKKNSRNGKK